MTVDKSLGVKVKAWRKDILNTESKHPFAELDIRGGGQYTENKLSAIRGYLYAFTKALTGKFKGLGYLETHAGPGVTKIRSSGRLLLGTPILAITNLPPFSKLRFIEVDRKIKEALEKRLGRYASKALDCNVMQGDCNAVIDSIINEYPTDWPTLFLMDPEGLDLDWNTIVTAGAHPKSELMIIFPYGMAIQRVAGTEDKSAGVTRLFGNDGWKTIQDEHEKGRISSLLAKRRFVSMFLDQLKDAGFKNTIVSKEIKSDRGNPLYFLIHASRVDLAAKIGKDIFGEKGFQGSLFDFQKSRL